MMPTPECYCLACRWAGPEDALVPHPAGVFSCCPACASLDIVFLTP